MALLRLDPRPLVSELRAELAVLLAGLADGDWARPTACPGWSGHAVAARLLGVEVGNVSVRRDDWKLGPAPGRRSGRLAERLQPAMGRRGAANQPAALLIELINRSGPG